MERDAFNKLVNWCDGLLADFPADDNIIGIPWLHVLNAHPNTLNRYRYAFADRGAFSRISFFLRSGLYHAAKMLSSLFEKRPAATGKIDIAFISHYVADRKERDDFYFGLLPEHAAEKGYRSLILLLDHTPGAKRKQVKAGLLEQQPPRYLLPKTLSFFEEWRLVKTALRSARKLKRVARKEDDKNKKSFYLEAALQAFAPESITALRIGKCMENLFRSLHPGRVVLTWEGRSWERLAVATAKRCAMPVVCFGYQHTVLLESSHAARHRLGSSYDPDVFLATGPTTEKILHNAFPGLVVKSFGSHRYKAPAAAGEAVKPLHTCLVTPEGIESESVLLFRFAIAAARENKHIEFIFRTHPVLPYSRLSRKYADLDRLPVNCSVSVGTPIETDFARSGVLLYRGSSVSMYAVLNGLKPVYLAVEDEMPIDPLYFLGNWRETVTDTHMFTQVVRHFYDNEPAQLAGCAEAWRACSDYIQPVDEAVFFEEHGNIK